MKTMLIAFLKKYLAITTLALVLVGCGGGDSNAKLIASHPKEPAGEVGLEAPPRHTVTLHQSQFKLQVRSVSRAIDQIEDLAHRYDGYAFLVQTWQQGQQDYATIEATVPAIYQTAFEDKLVGLGDVLSETHWDESINGHDQDEYWERKSTITINLESAPPIISSGRSPGWNPSNTFWNAFDVAASILTFLIDILIWLLVVVGPLAAIGWGIKTALQKWSLNQKDE